MGAETVTHQAFNYYAIKKMRASISFSRSIASKMFSVDEKPVTPLACGQQNVNKGEMNAFKTKSRAKGRKNMSCALDFIQNGRQNQCATTNCSQTSHPPTR
jgi:hypothetical protein